MAHSYDPRFERKVSNHGKRSVIAGVEHTAQMEWGVGGFERQQPRYMEGDHNRPPIPHPYRKYPPDGTPTPTKAYHGPPTPVGPGGNKYVKQG